MKYKGYALVFDEVEADNEEQAREKIADKLGNDYFSWFDSNEIVLQNELKSENKGEWIKIQSGDKDFSESIVCNKCYHENSHLDFNEHNEPIGKVFVKSKFCPNCGADMRGKA